MNEKREATGYDQLGPEADVVLVGIGKIPLEQAIAEPEPMPDMTGDEEDGGEVSPVPEEEKPAKAKIRAFEDDLAKRTQNAKTLDELSATLGELLNSPYDVGPDGHLCLAKTDTPAPARKSFWAEPERKSLLWKAFDRRLAMQERQFVAACPKYLRQQADRIKAGCRGLSTPGLIDVEAEVKAYAERFFPFYERAFKYAGQAGCPRHTGQALGTRRGREGRRTGVPSQSPSSWRNSAIRSPRAPSISTRPRASSSKFFVEDAAIENVTTEQLTQELWKALDDRAAWEARRIASTEMTRTDGWGSVEGYKQNDAIDMKGWNCQKLDTSREDHIDADGQEVGVDDDFEIGGEAMAWPGDDRASAGNVCNCRCSTYPVVGSL